MLSRLGTAAVVVSAQVAGTLRAMANASPDSYSFTDKGKVYHPWVVEQVDKLMDGMTSGRSRVCPHISRKPQPAFAFVHDLGELRCAECTAARPRLSEVDDVTCDRCQRYCRGLWTCAVAVGAVVLFIGLCDRCSDETGRSEAGFTAA